MPEPLLIIDLFCGAGGLSLGFRDEGFRVQTAYDNWQPAIRTYQTNFPHPVVECDITDCVALPHADVIAGGPPCQGFSSAGMGREQDGRNSLVRVFSQLIVTAKPAAFVFENVEGFLTSSGGRYLFDLLDPLIATGYRIHLRKVNAANYGVPQHRKRVIAIGGLQWDPSFPEPTHSAFGAPGAHLAGRHLPPTPSLGRTIDGLPDAVLTAAGNDETDHVFAPLNSEDAERAALLAPGQRMRDLPEELWHESYRRRAHRRVKDGTPTERRGGPPAGLRRLRADEPSKAITGGALNEFLHPSEHRPLTIRECARLQTFPDDFRFLASRRDAIQLIGNAVPPLLARHLAASLADDLRQAKLRHQSGALLTFVPTLAAGVSPILKEIMRQVFAKYEPADASSQMRLQWA